MIKQLKIQNFKCFKQPKTFEFSKLNLLTGINGRGKSTLLQVFLILSQTAWKDNKFCDLVINGELLSLGNFDDIKNSETPRSEEIIFNFEFEDFYVKKADLQYKEKTDESLLAELHFLKFWIKGKNKNLNEHDGKYEIALNNFTDYIKKIHYISADRLGPVKYVDKINLPKFIHTGARGENTINILANSFNLENVNDILYLGNNSKSVIQQTIEWLSFVLEGAKIDIKGIDKESSILYMLLNNRSNSYSYKPVNVGFGYSYILPLIVSGLLAKPGEIIIVENPEAHIHPRAQSRIAEFFAIVASTGVQVFIESHSEHILNGLRVSTLKPQNNILHNELIIHYFNESFSSEKLVMDEKGKIANWPNGFFDQQESDLAEIFKYSR